MRGAGHSSAYRAPPHTGAVLDGEGNGGAAWVEVANLFAPIDEARMRELDAAIAAEGRYVRDVKLCPGGCLKPASACECQKPIAAAPAPTSLRPVTRSDLAPRQREVLEEPPAATVPPANPGPTSVAPVHPEAPAPPAEETNMRGGAHKPCEECGSTTRHKASCSKSGGGTKKPERTRAARPARPAQRDLKLKLDDLSVSDLVQLQRMVGDELERRKEMLQEQLRDIEAATAKAA